MKLALEIFAFIILSMYGVYFWHIMKNNTLAFEMGIIKSLAAWIINTGPAIKTKIWLLIFVSFCLEAFYFTIAFLTIRNPIYQLMTLFFVGAELFHLGQLSNSMRSFFKGQKMISQVFNWHVERISALLFFTHSLLTLLVLFFIKT